VYVGDPERESSTNKHPTATGEPQLKVLVAGYERCKILLKENRKARSNVSKQYQDVWSDIRDLSKHIYQLEDKKKAIQEQIEEKQFILTRKKLLASKVNRDLTKNWDDKDKIEKEISSFLLAIFEEKTSGKN
jgi:septal ring factor EnvC (AmiA/AmiB activator)